MEESSFKGGITGSKRGGKVLYQEGLEKSHMASHLQEILNIDFESSTNMMWLEISVQLSPWLPCNEWRSSTYSDNTSHFPFWGSQGLGGKGSPRGQQPSWAQPSTEQHRAWMGVRSPHHS